ncbi:non-ribosomal peptide synthetase [Streptantibioticus ferralitis]|uniref:Non-ribosomal peptide synthetase n=1 Tax=Streptantibioticus ferralitis TaxID=236510 RepID=A0ABT5ZC17_9ACTN|nr:non-ribosomal peptide synthetase [Streptantibioticus ferralitis]MDF2261182.1 non-ribosomal peptide synthetase [Streptantibioticus ferralitis]
MTGRPVGRTVPELFEAQAARTPDAPAVLYKHTSLTYGALNERANKLARLLIDRGVGPDHLVALAVPRSPELVVALLAILKAGGAYLPLDPRYPAARKAFMVQDAAPRLLVRAGAGRAEGVELDNVVLDSQSCAEACSRYSGANVRQTERREPLSDLHLMYVIYTSGSTGTPKGVAVTHEGVADLVATQADRFRPAPGDRVLAWASISFDAGFWDIALALLHGGTLVMADDEDLLPGDALHETLVKYEIDHAVLPPAALSVTDSESVLLSGTIMSTGDACTPALVRTWAPSRRMFNGYGPTEVTVGCTIAGPITEADGVGIGVPWTGARVHVLDERLRPVAVGEEGELYLAGSGLARGYVGRPGLTAARFLPDPFGPPGSRMYRSGDRGRRDADGRFHFAGRADGQVKLRGFRVELGEIEAFLTGQPDVDLAAVVVDGELADARLVAYVTARPGAVVDSSDLRERLAAALPEFMVPTRIEVLDAFPTMPNGKIDRGALASRDGTAVLERPCAPREPDSPEDRLYDTVARLLDLPRVDPEANFFDLGGNSLLAGRLIGSLREELGVRVPVRAVLGARDLREIAQSLNG